MSSFNEWMKNYQGLINALDIGSNSTLLGTKA